MSRPPKVDLTGLHEAASRLPTSYAIFRGEVDDTVSVLHDLDPELHEPVTERMAEEIPRVLDAAEDLRQAWRPYMKPRLIRVEPPEKPT